MVSRENPDWMQDVCMQYPEMVNAWAGIFEDHIIGPFIIDGNLNGDNYFVLF